MITNFDNHWDNLARFDGKTWFTYPMIKWPYNDDLPSTPVETIFIKRDKSSRQFEKSWIGIADNFEQGTNPYGKKCVWFRVRLEKSYTPGDAMKVKSEGWYQLASAENVNTSLNSSDSLHPPFFKTILTTADWAIFEEYSYYLLRVLGIHDIFRFPQNDNRGKADGFFKFDNRLAVLYDATLDQQIEKKEQQIDNYIGQLAKDTFKHGIISHTIKGIDRQVWILTQKDLDVRIIKEHDSIKVKIVPVKKLMELYDKRLSIDVSQDKFWDMLKDI